MLVKAYAKVNLGLSVGAARDDGYHDLHSVMMSVDLFDLVNVAVRVSADEKNTVTVKGCDFVDEKKNTAYRAAVDFLAEFGIGGKIVDISVTKNIPVAAGFGGSSADAAGVLFALSEIFGVASDGEKTLSVASRAGSDVAAMLVGGCTEICGRGDVVKKMRCRTDFHFVLAVGEKCSTSTVFAAFDAVGVSGDDCVPSVKAAIADGSLKKIVSAVKNDLVLPCIAAYPKQKAFIDACQKVTGVAPTLSGSGGGVFWLTESDEESDEICRLLANQGIFAFACHSTGVGVETVKSDIKD